MWPKLAPTPLWRVVLCCVVIFSDSWRVFLSFLHFSSILVPVVCFSFSFSLFCCTAKANSVGERENHEQSAVQEAIFISPNTSAESTSEEVMRIEGKIDSFSRFFFSLSPFSRYFCWLTLAEADVWPSLKLFCSNMASTHTDIDTHTQQSPTHTQTYAQKHKCPLTPVGR